MMRRVAAVFVFLVVASGWLLAQDSPLPGPAGGFSGGTVPNAVVLTGDNASGTGTLRIRPSDEDTQIVLCEASNNSSPEMCSNLQHVNISATQSFSALVTNGYYDSASAIQRRDTASGVAGINTSAGTTAANTFTQMFVSGTGGASAGAVLLQASGLATSNLILGSVGTVTTDIRGPILNGGSATCNGTNAGSVCISDTLVSVYGDNASYTVQGTTTTSGPGFSITNNAAALQGGIRWGDTAFGFTDMRARINLYAAAGSSVTIGNTADVAVAGVVADTSDAIAGTAIRHSVTKGGGLVSLGGVPQALTCTDSGGAGAGALAVDPQSSTVIITNADTLGGCAATVAETTVSGTYNQLGARVTICSSPQSQATLLTFADVANIFRGGATQATGLLPGDCFDMVYIDATDDLWLAVSPVSIN